MKNKVRKIFCLLLVVSLLSVVCNAKNIIEQKSNSVKDEKYQLNLVKVAYGIINISSEHKVVIWKPYLKGASLFAGLKIADKIKTTISNEKEKVEVISSGEFLLKIVLGKNKFKDIHIKKGVTKFSLGGKKQNICKNNQQIIKDKFAGNYKGVFKMTDNNCVSCHATANITKKDDYYLLNFIVYKKGKQLIYKLKSKCLNKEILNFTNHKFNFKVKNGKIQGDLIKKEARIAKIQLGMVSDGNNKKCEK